jgi:Icc-related predicted phosphoesterase
MPKIKILCISDIHNSQQFLRSLNEHLTSNKINHQNYCSSEARTKKLFSSQPTVSASNSKYDLVLCAGDVVSRPNKKALDFFKEFINIICNLHQTRLFMVHGNNETEKMIDLIRKKNVLIHLKVKKFRGYKFFGIGGWMEDVGEITNLKSQISKAILLTHLPPKRVQSISTNFHKSQSISGGPLIHLCGHLHAPGMIWRIGETLVVKIPTAMYGEAALLEMPGRKIKFIEL